MPSKLKRFGSTVFLFALAFGLAYGQPVLTNTPTNGPNDNGTFSFTVSPNSTTLLRGGNLGVTVIALDNGGNVHTSFRGTIHFSSTDPLAVLPADYTYSNSDNGVATFTTVFNSNGTQTVSVVDNAVPSVAGTSPSISVLDPTSTFTNTATNSPSNTPSDTPTPTFTSVFTDTPTNSFTSTNTSTSSPSNTPTDTPTNSFTPTFTNTATSTPTDTPSDTPTSTFTPVFTDTPTNSSTFTNTATNSPSDTPSDTPTSTFTPVFTDTPTSSSTFTFTNTATNSPSNTPTDTPTNSFTSTFSNTATNSPTDTPSDTPTPTFTSTPTNSSTFTFTNTMTNSPSNTPTNTSTSRFTPTFTNTSTNTASFTPTSTNTPAPPVLSFSAGTKMPSNTILLAGSVNMPVLQVLVSNTSTEGVNLTYFVFTSPLSETGADSGITAVHLWKDVSGNGVVDASSVILASSTYVNHAVTLGGFPLDSLTAGSSQNYLLSYDFSATSTAGTYTTALLVNPSISGTGQVTGLAVQSTGLPVNGAVLTVVNPTNTPTATFTNSSTFSFTPTSTASFTPTATYSNTSTSTASFTPTSTPTNTPTNTPTLCFTFVAQWGGTGKGVGQFNIPIGLAVKGPYVYVADYLNNRIQKFDINGGWVTNWGDGFQNSTQGQFYQPWRITVGPDGNFYVTEFGNNRIQVVDPNGNTLFIIGGPGGGNGTFNAPRGCALDNKGFLYVADTGNHLIQKFKVTGTTATFIKQWGGQGACNLAPGTFNQGTFCTLTDIAADNNGNLYAADQGGNSVQKFDTNGNYLGQIGNSVGVNPTGLGVGQDGNIYVASQGGVSITAFDPTGNLLYPLGGYGSLAGQFLGATGIAFDSCGDLFAVDSSGSRVEKFVVCGSTCNIPVPPTVTPTFTWTFTNTFTFTPTSTFTSTWSPTFTYSFTPTFTPTRTFTPTATITPTMTSTWTNTSTFTPSASPTVTFTPTLDLNYGVAWSLVTNPASFSGRWGSASVVFNNQIFMIGGTNGSVTFSDVWSSSDGTNWTNLNTNAPFGGRTYSSAVVYAGKIWLIAGSTNNDVWSSPDGVTWTQVTPEAAFSARSGQSVVVFNDGSGDKMWLVGGKNSLGSYFRDVWNSSDGLTWTSMVRAPFTPRAGHGCVVANGTMYVIGGGQQGSTGIPLNDVWSTSNGVSWSEQTSSAPFVPRQSFGCVRANGRIWVMGGLGQPRGGILGVLGDVWCSVDGATWNQVLNLSPFVARDSQACVNLADKLWILGGRNILSSSPVTTALNDIWVSPSGLGSKPNGNNSILLSSVKATGVSGDRGNSPTFTPSPTATPTPAYFNGGIQTVVALPNISRNSQPIHFHLDLKAAGKISLTLFTLTGDRVYGTEVEAVTGANDILWTLRNNSGSTVASGLYVYFLQVETEGRSETRSGKIVVIR